MEIPQEFLVRYLVHRREDFKRCQGFLEEKNFVELEKIGHQLKGNGLTFGFPDLSEIGQDLEEEAKRTDCICLKKILERFSSWIKEKAS